MDWQKGLPMVNHLAKLKVKHLGRLKVKHWENHLGLPMDWRKEKLIQNLTQTNSEMSFH
jgi:hypothetical protein